MAEIVLGIGTSHSPMLSLAPEHWDIRTQADREMPSHPYRGESYTFDELTAVRDTDHFARLDVPEARRERFERCQTAMAALADRIAEVAPDVLVLIGDDQKDWFHDDNMPSFAVYLGDSVLGAGFDATKSDIPEPMIPVALSYRPPENRQYPIQADLARQIMEGAIADEFDPTACIRPPEGADGPIGIGHAFGFVIRRILNDRLVPTVPVMVNTYYPPNQPSAKRCYEFGKSIGRAIEAWPADARVAVVASGGLSHFVIDEELDQRMIAAMAAGDVPALAAEPEALFQSGTSEIKNWLAACGALSNTGFGMDVLDYVPCYRSDVGTGTAMAFAIWS